MIYRERSGLGESYEMDAEGCYQRYGGFNDDEKEVESVVFKFA